MKKRLHSKDDEAASIALDGEGGLSVLGKNGLSGGKTEYMLVRYAKKELTIPPGDGAASPALAFTEQRGQLTDTSGTSVEGVRFYSTGSFPPLYVQNDTLSFVTASVDTSSATPDTLHRVDITFFDSKTSLMSAAGLDKLDNYRNYYLGHIPEGRSRVGQYGRVAVTDLYDGIHLQMFADESGIVYYFVIEPGGDPADIELEFNGQDALSLNGSKLQVGNSVGSFDLPAPSAFQVNSQGQEVSTVWAPAYSIAGNRVSFSSTGTYDSGEVLVIELRRGGATAPGLTGNLDWCTYIGGSAKGLYQDEALSDIDSDGEHIYALGITNNLDFPVETGAIVDFSENKESVLLKFSTGGVLQWGTFYGGSSVESSSALLSDGSRVYIGGSTTSNDLPLLSSGPNAYVNSSSGIGGYRGYLARFNSELGQLAWSTYFGDNNANFNEINALAKNPVTSALMVTGNAGTGSNFPLLDIGSGFFESSGLEFLSEFNIEEKIIWSSRFGSTSCDIFDIKYDSKGNLFLTGVDKDLTSSSDDLPIIGSGTTYTQSHTNETLNDAIIAKIDTDRELVWSTFFGDLGSDSGRSLAISNDDKVFLLGQVQGGFSAFPLLNYSSSSYFDDIRNDNDMFIARFSNKGEQEWTSYFGGSQNDFASKLVYDEDNDLIIVAGITQSTDISSSFFSSSLYPIVRGKSGGNFADSPEALADGINF
ncbi:hypothetical protein [Phaeodactylibacter xiamenensis]|uniref:DUF7948 domain-containing protein n=1 Tax=Phaeodactylibacter xiamenensis TaxID=1524460 RepID=UPI003BAAF4FB